MEKNDTSALHVYFKADRSNGRSPNTGLSARKELALVLESLPCYQSRRIVHW